MTITELLRGRSTLDQPDILMRADALRTPHVFNADGKDVDHCHRCAVHRQSSEAAWNGGTCPPWTVGRYYGGPLTDDVIGRLLPRKPPQQVPHQDSKAKGSQPPKPTPSA